MLAATVLIVGSGPVGLWLAYELRSANIDVLVIDSLPGRDKRNAYSKALSISAGALETFESRGVAGLFLKSGIPMKKAHFGGILLDLNTDVLGAQHSCNLIIPQSRTEEILLDLCENVGVKFGWGMEFCSLNQTEEAISVTARGMKGEDVLIEARWMVGCDGTHSNVRNSAGIAFEGTPSTLSGALADVQLSTKPSDTGILLGKGSAAGTSIVPIGDGVHSRFVSALKPASTTPVSEIPTLNQVKELLREAFGSDFGAHSPLWFSRFGNACRVASSFRAGRVFLAGDAGHQLFPAGGQGMNLGFQDATSLAWRLVMVAKGDSLCDGAAERILESYSRERRAAAEAVNKNVQAQIALMTSRNPPEVALRNVFKEAFQNPDFNAMWARRVTGFGDPTDPYTHKHLEATDAASKFSSNEPQSESVVGMRATSQICGRDMEAVFRATTLDKFVLLQRNEGAKIEDGHFNLILKPWANKVTVLRMTAEVRGEKRQSLDALLIRPDMRIAWVVEPELPKADRQSTFAAVLKNWFGSQQ